MVLSTQPLLKSFIFTTCTLILTLLLPRRTSVPGTAAAATIPSPNRHSHVISASDIGVSVHDDDHIMDENECRWETMWWGDDDLSTHDDNGNISSDKIPKKQRHKSIQSWWKSMRQQSRQTVGQNRIKSKLPLPPQQQQSQQHPLRTDLYEVHCQWRGMAHQQQHRRRRRRRRKGQRALWTSRLAFNENDGDDDTDTSDSSLSNREISSICLQNYSSSNNDGDHIDVKKRLIYDFRTFQLEFDPNGYVRFLPPPFCSQNTCIHDVVGRYNNNKRNFEWKDDTTDTESCIGTWKLQPNGLVVQLPLPILNKGQGHPEQQPQQHLIMEMDFHMNPFGVQPKFTRGLIFLPADNHLGNLWMKLLRIRPIVGTFTGKGIGIDTVDLSYQQRN